jgi:hypothetical protein
MATRSTKSTNSILRVSKILQRLPGITGSIETGPTYKYVWTTGAHGKLEDSLHFMLQLTVEALDWIWLLVIAAQRRRAAEVATQAFHVELREGAPAPGKVEAVDASGTLAHCVMVCNKVLLHTITLFVS